MKNQTIREYFKLSELDRVPYNVTLSALKQRNTFNGHIANFNRSFTEMRSVFKMAKEYLKNIAKIYAIIFGISEEEFFNTSITELYATKDFVIKSIEEMIKKENAVLKMPVTENDAKVKQASGDLFVGFEDVSPLVSLGRKFSMYPFDLGQKPYDEILLLLIQDNREKIFEINLSKIK